MKKLLFILLVGFMLFSGCVQNQNQKQPTKEQSNNYILKQYLDNFISENKDCTNNEITKEECSNKLSNEFITKYLGDSINCISELPLKFEMLMKYDNEEEYVVKFSFGEFSSEIDISDNYSVTFQVFSIVDKFTAMELKEGELYNIKGSCHDFANCKGSFILPSGKCFNDYPKVSSYENKPSFNLGTLIVKDLTYTLAK